MAHGGASSEEADCMTDGGQSSEETDLSSIIRNFTQIESQRADAYKVPKI